MKKINILLGLTLNYNGSKNFQQSTQIIEAQHKFITYNGENYILLKADNEKKKGIIDIYKIFKNDNLNSIFDEEAKKDLIFTGFMGGIKLNNTFNQMYIGALTAITLLGTFLVDYIYIKEKTFDSKEILELLKKDNLYLIYALCIMLNIRSFSIRLHTKIKLAEILATIFGSLLMILIFIKPMDMLTLWFFNMEKNNDKFKPLVVSQLVFSLILLTYWNFYTYPKNKKYFDRNIKNKFYKYEKEMFLVKSNNNSCFMNFLDDSSLLYIKESEKASFEKEMLTI